MIFYDASTDPELAVEAAVLTEVVRAATAVGVEVLVIGAVARDILIRHLLGARPERATKDVDVAVAVADWPAYEDLTASLQRSSGPSHRFVVDGVDVDVIPFGGIESPRRMITWPDQMAMDVHGFAEAHRQAVVVRLPGGLEVRVASLPAQSALKVLAWRDRRHEGNKDAIDLKTILAAASEGQNLEDLYEQHSGLLERLDYDPLLAGAARLGADAAALLDPESTDVVVRLLEGDGVIEALAARMGRNPTANAEMLEAYLAGLRAAQR
jgi:predicted nucleotidyltransferase